MKEDNTALNIPHHTAPPVTLPSSNNATSILNKTQVQLNGAVTPSSNTTNGNSPNTNKGGYKIVVNNYHAHSILSNQDGNSIATCLINTPLDGNTKLFQQQIGDAPTPSSAKHKNVDNSNPANLEKLKSKASNKDTDDDLQPRLKEVGSNDALTSGEEATPTEILPPKSVVMITNNQQCDAAGEDDIGSNLDDDDDEDLGGEFLSCFFFFFFC